MRSILCEHKIWTLHLITHTQKEKNNRKTIIKQSLVFK